MTDLEALAARVEGAKDVAAIAAGLTKAQREALCNPLEIGGEASLWYDTNSHTAYALHRRSLVDDHFMLTPLGAALRAHLTAGATHDR